MANLKGSKTEDNLKAAFAGESQANRRYLYFAQKADVEGYNDVAAVFRSTAEGETGHAHGHLEFLEVSGDPATGLPIGPTGANLKAAIAGETHEYTDMYPGMARTAREEGFAEDRRLVRDAGQGGEEPRRPLPEGTRHDGLSACSALRRGPARVPFFVLPTPNETASTCAKAAWKPPPATPSIGGTRGSAIEKALEAEMERVFRHLPRLPALLQPVRFLPAAVRPDRQRSDRRSRRREERGLRPGRRGLHALRHVLHDQVSLRAAARMGGRFPASHAASPRGPGAQEGHRPGRPRARRHRPQRASWAPSPPGSPTGRPTKPTS